MLTRASRIGLRGHREHCDQQTPHSPGARPVSDYEQVRKPVATIVAQIKLTPPGHVQSPTGIAEVFLAGKRQDIQQYSIYINATGLARNTDRNAYAAWLTGFGQSVLLGVADGHVGRNHRLRLTGALPADASSHRHLVITLEDRTVPSRPGQVILQGTLAF